MKIGVSLAFCKTPLSPLSWSCRWFLMGSKHQPPAHSVVSFGASIGSGSIVGSRCHAGWLWTCNVSLPLIYGSTQIHLLQPTVSVPGQNPLQEQLKAYIKCHGDLERRLQTLWVHLLTCVSVFHVPLGRAVCPQPFLKSMICGRFIFFKHFTMDFHTYY